MGIDEDRNEDVFPFILPLSQERFRKSIAHQWFIGMGRYPGQLFSFFAAKNRLVLEGVVASNKKTRAIMRRRRFDTIQAGVHMTPMIFTLRLQESNADPTVIPPEAPDAEVARDAGPGRLILNLRNNGVITVGCVKLLLEQTRNLLCNLAAQAQGRPVTNRGHWSLVTGH